MSVMEAVMMHISLYYSQETLFILWEMLMCILIMLIHYYNRYVGGWITR